MSVYKQIVCRRSIRKFKQEQISYRVLEKCVNAARLAPSGGNLQPLEYVIVDEENLLGDVFDTLKWANYLDGWYPLKTERPTAYIVILINREILPDGGEYDVGMAAENIILTALDEGVTSCCVGFIDKGKLNSILNLSNKYEIELVIALGYPNEESVSEELSSNSVKYWRDGEGIMHVPKRRLDTILHRNIIN